MPDAAGFGELSFERAALAVEEALRLHLGIAPERLDFARLRADYPRREYKRGWRIGLEFSDKVVRRLDLLVGTSFPAGWPRTALVDRPDYLHWPHIERDGVLCLLPPSAETDAENPGIVAVHLLGRSIRLVEELIEGTIVDRDFREEFLTYWFYAAIPGATRVQSVLRPEGPTRTARVFRDGRETIVVGEDDGSLQAWLAAQPASFARQGRKIDKAALIWLPQPLVPSEYPETGADLLDLAKRVGGGAEELLLELAEGRAEDLLVMLGAEGRGGPGLVAASTGIADRAPALRGGPDHPLAKGFRTGPRTKPIAASRVFSAQKLVRANVDRADSRWIHGRGGDVRAERLLAATVTIIGCGSLGAPIAARLARAGAGTMHLVDCELLSWSNVGRHELGAGSVGRNKAVELAERLRRDLPHLSFHGHDLSAQALVSDGRLLSGSDLVIVVTGSWDAEGALNRWHVSNGRPMPFVYGWAEELALAGHAVTIVGEGGCLRCGIGPTGVPGFRALSWPSGPPLHEEPACGVPYQPYGAVEISSVADIVARAALDALLVSEGSSREMLWLGDGEALAGAGGAWNHEVLGIRPATSAGLARVARAWPITANCPACGGLASHQGKAA